MAKGAFEDAVLDSAIDFHEGRIQYHKRQIKSLEKLRTLKREKTKKKKIRGIEIKQVFVDEAQHVLMTDHEAEQERRKYFP